VSAFASLALIIAGALVMDWYRLSFADVASGVEKITIDLRNVHICIAGHPCAIAPVTPLPGMFPTLATVTLWASLGVAALVVFQASARVLAGNANDSLTKVGYMLALLTISLAVATTYMFGPEPEGPGIGLAAQMGITLHRTWAPLTLLVGHIVGFATLYMAVAPGSSDLDAAYQPVALAPAHAMLGGRARIPPDPLPSPANTAAEPGPVIADAGSEPSATDGLDGSDGLEGVAGPARLASRARTATLPPVPDHLRHRLSYVALTAELTAGGIDARREDGSSRLVLWRDVVGVVARRMPPAYDSATFVDIVSTVGSTLRIMAWTRLTGEPIEARGDARPLRIVERVAARCPEASIDPATRKFVETGEAAQLPDLELLRAHDERLA
jgi:hypothetical protein